MLEPKLTQVLYLHESAVQCIDKEWTRRYMKPLSERVAPYYMHRLHPGTVVINPAHLKTRDYEVLGDLQNRMCRHYVEHFQGIILQLNLVHDRDLVTYLQSVECVHTHRSLISMGGTSVEAAIAVNYSESLFYQRINNIIPAIPTVYYPDGYSAIEKSQVVSK